MAPPGSTDHFPQPTSHQKRHPRKMVGVASATRGFFLPRSGPRVAPIIFRNRLPIRKDIPGKWSVLRQQREAFSCREVTVRSTANNPASRTFKKTARSHAPVEERSPPLPCSLLAVSLARPKDRISSRSASIAARQSPSRSLKSSSRTQSSCVPRFLSSTTQTGPISRTSMGPYFPWYPASADNSQDSDECIKSISRCQRASVPSRFAATSISQDVPVSLVP